MRTTAWLVRHGESATNNGGPALWPAAIPLTELGVRQARGFASSVTTRPDHIVTSGFVRSIDSALPLKQRWPQAACHVWPIEELTYLSPRKVMGATFEERREVTKAYWERSDPHYRDATDAETFAEFVARVALFDHMLSGVSGFVIVVGHGQFFRAHQLGREIGFQASSEWMARYRAMETAAPMRNCEVLQVEYREQEKSNDQL